MKDNKTPPPPVPADAPPLDLLALAEKDPQKALAILQQQSDFHRPTRSKHTRSLGPAIQVKGKAKEKKLRKMAKASEKANRQHANKKRRPTGSKRRK
jgi:hypothetical protein